MGIFSKLISAAGSKSSTIVKRGAKQAQKGKTGPAVNAFARAGQNGKKSPATKR
jgi:hypothetical protein